MFVLAIVGSKVVVLILFVIIWRKGIGLNLSYSFFNLYFCTMRCRKATFISYLSLLILSLNACQSDQKNYLYQKWKTISLKNSTMEKEIREMKDYIDTIGQNDSEFDL